MIAYTQNIQKGYVTHEELYYLSVRCSFFGLEW